MSVEITIRIFRDGNQWCAMVGENLQDGLAGFGETISKALQDLGRQTAEFQDYETEAK